MLDPFTDKEKGGRRGGERFDARRTVKFFLGERDRGEIYSLWRLRDRDTIEARIFPRDVPSGSDVDLGRFELRFSFLPAECSTGNAQNRDVVT